MGYFDDPAIDTASQVSEESVLATKQAFLQKNGFLVREENPDKGVDLDVELIIGQQVSGFKFAIQIKSAQNLQTIKKKGKSYICYTIKTSRLGYLCRRRPGFGLIVVYDEQSGDLYYDFVEKIFHRIRKFHRNDEWMQNDTVAFHIGRNKIVDSESTIAIYDKMKQRALNFSDMYSQNAPDFDLPTFELNRFENPLLALEKFGHILFNKKEYQIIYDLLAKMNLSKVLSNPKIVLLAAITYYRIGQHVEGDYFLSKCNSHLDEYTDAEREQLQISKIVSDFSLGKINRSTYLEKLNELAATVKPGVNSIDLSLQTVFAELLNVKIYDDISIERVLKKIEAIEGKLKELDVVEEERYFYMIEVFTFMHEIGIRYFLRTAGRMMIQKHASCVAPYEERSASAKVLARLIWKPQEQLREIVVFSLKTQNAYLQAAVLFKRAYMFYSFMFQNVLLTHLDEADMKRFKEKQSEQLFEAAYRDIITAYDIFMQRRDLSHAYKSLSISIEINYLFSFIFARNIDDDLYMRTEKALKDLEKELNIERYSIITEKMLIDHIAIKETSMLDGYSSLTAEETRHYARMILQTLDLPAERLDNLISEFNFMRKAKEAIDFKYFDVLQNLTHTKSKDTLYREIPRYVIRCKKCGYETDESDSLDDLLWCLRMGHAHICL